MALDPITAGLNFGAGIADIVKKWVPDTDLANKITGDLVSQGNQLLMAQVDLNKEEAKSPSLFMSGWRPACAWVCVLSLAYAVVGYTFLTWVIQFYSLSQGVVIPKLPPPDATLTFEVLFGMLGLGGYRTYEKLKGVTT